MTTGASSTRTPATPQVAGLLLGPVALAAGWWATGSWWRGLFSGLTGGLAAYAAARRQQVKADRRARRALDEPTTATP